MDEFFEVLRILTGKLKGIGFAVIGSYNLYLQGIDVNPNDLDVFVDDRDMGKISRMFKGKITINKLGHREIKLKINGVEIHIGSNLNETLRPPFRENTVWLKKGNLKIPCMSLESELSFYEKVKRKKDKKKIEFIKERLGK